MRLWLIFIGSLAWTNFLDFIIPWVSGRPQHGATHALVFALALTYIMNENLKRIGK